MLVLNDCLTPPPLQAMAAGTLPVDRYVVPFTFAGHLTSAAVSAPVPSDATYYLAVRACYPAAGGCFDPVVSGPLVVESQAPDAGVINASFSESGDGKVAVAASWDHFTEVCKGGDKNDYGVVCRSVDMVWFDGFSLPNCRHFSSTTSRHRSRWVCTSGHWRRHRRAQEHTLPGSRSAPPWRLCKRASTGLRSALIGSRGRGAVICLF